MSSTRQKARSRAYPSISIPSSNRTSSKQDKGKTLASPAAPNPLSSAPFPDSDEDLSDAPENPVLPRLPMSSYPPLRRYSQYSDDDFSNVPTTPVFPTSPSSPRPPPLWRVWSDEDLSALPSTPTFPRSPSHRPNSPPSNSDSELSDAPENPVWPEGPKIPSRPPPTTVRHRLPPCTESYCPVRKAVRCHDQGPYLHKGKQPEIKDTEFRESNPPPRVWEIWRKIKADDRTRTIDNESDYFRFLSLHVDIPGRER